MTCAVTTGLTEAEEAQLVTLLSKVGQPWSRRFYEQMAELLPNVAIEAVILRRRPDGSIQVLLVDRPLDDIHWRGMVNCPGAVLQVGDQPSGQSFQSVLNRLSQEEVGTPFSRANHVGFIHRGRGARANTVQHVFAVELDGEPLHGEWYDVERLPDNLVGTQDEIIALAVSYQRERWMR